MNFFVPEDLLRNVCTALECNRDNAMKELLRQTRRIHALYTQEPRRRARYWSNVDASALYAIAHNRQLPRDILDVAIFDLEKAEAIVAALDPDSQQVYHDFVYFVEKVTRSARDKADLLDRVAAFIEPYSAEQIACLIRFVALDAGSETLNSNLRDAIKRVRANVNTKVKSAFKSRMELVIDFMKKKLAERPLAESGLPPVNETPENKVTPERGAPEKVDEKQS